MTCTILGDGVKTKHTSACIPVLEAFKNKLGVPEGLVSSNSCSIEGSPGIQWKGGNQRVVVLSSYQLYGRTGVGCIGGGVTMQIIQSAAA